MSNDIDIARVVEVFSDLDQSLSTFFQGENEAKRQFRIDASKLTSYEQQAVREIESAQEAAVAAHKAAQPDHQLAAAAQHETDTLRIEGATRRSRQKLLQEMRQKEEQARGKVQQTTWSAGNAYDAKASAAKQLHAEMTETLKERLPILESTGRRLRKLFRILPEARLAFSEHTADTAPQPAALEGSPDGLLAALDEALGTVEDSFRQARASVSLAPFRSIRLPLAIALLVVMHVAIAGLAVQVLERPSFLLHVLISLVVLTILALITHAVAKRKAQPIFEAARSALLDSWHLYHSTARAAEKALETTLREQADIRDTAIAGAKSSVQDVPAQTAQQREEGLKRIEARHGELLQKAEQRRARELGKRARDTEAELARLQEHAEHEATRVREDVERKRARRVEILDAELLQLEGTCRQAMSQTCSAVATLNQTRPLAGSWGSSGTTWEPPLEFAHLVPFGRVHAKLPELPERVVDEELMPFLRQGELTLPVSLTFPGRGSLLLQTRSEGRDTAISILNSVMLRLLTTIPPGKVSFTLIDPIGLGQSFAGMMHLADYGETLVGGKIWTDPRHIEQRLADLNEHMEKVIQMYLRNEYATITEYNEQAGEIAEKYRFLVIADFPANFSEQAAQRLISIATTGARCGVFMLVHFDQRHSLPQDCDPAELRKNAVTLQFKGGRFSFANFQLNGLLELTPPPPPDRMNAILRDVAAASEDAGRVEVSFKNILPAEDTFWKGDATSELRIPIGRAGATKLQLLALGRGTLQHVLIAGKTGSGKSTLLHVLITNLALWFRPDEVEVYLIDFKKGVEFKPYATHRLPHARAVAIESDREFGLSVLHRVDEELKRRGTLFRQYGVQDMKGYRAVEGAAPIPRTLVIIDEFQEFFVEDDGVAQNANLLLDRIVRQGRAFGIHVLLGSQTIGGAYTLARSTLGQMGVRIALQCSEADSYLILNDDNAAARLLSRPGEAIYNDAAGMVEGNNPFQVVWLPDAERDEWLTQVSRIAKDVAYKPETPTIVFEGNAPADMALNPLLEEAILAPAPADLPHAPKAWLGAPNAIKGPTEIILRRQSGSNALLVGQRDEAALSLMQAAAIALSAQFPAEGVRFVIFDGSPPDVPRRAQFERLSASLRHPLDVIDYPDVTTEVGKLDDELQERLSSGTAGHPAIILFVYGLQRFSKLRFEEDFGFSMGDEPAPANPSQQFDELIREGPAAGIHTIVWSDTLNNINRTLNRRSVSEFEMRILFQMSASDSANLIDTPQASRLGLHRALLYNEQAGTLEKFRPYSQPDEAWLDHVGEQLRD
ncbi:MAG: ATP-binding protein [Lentisphaerae bacterium]|jgi:DNA segregation ATPase FtsK/SpoIIIE, S-DNA-T family|nr:ATP-binding protein [Lentisphaerota bacterium]MBT4816303.1 ATP-binding protein [Lentisphaerota bacterium]MBT5606556.1 ATP-binding protein [Lentisphaerota bacterium]MBT7053465.1 ATP-binding protein [Lentisphaerota bacterium]MBT7846792.1 ATP-binding protein [Lentisphaerota bacterium]